MDDDVYDIPREASGDSVFGSPPPALPPKLSSESFKSKEKLLSASSPPPNKPVPKPRKHVSGRSSISPTVTSPTSRPVPKPRPRTMSKEKIFSEDPDISAVVETKLDDVKLPPDADEAARMVEDMVEAKFASSTPVNKNPIYDFEEFIGNRESKEVSGETVLKPQVISNDTNVLTPVISGQEHVSDPLENVTSDDMYTNIESVLGLSRSDPDGATEPVNNTDSIHRILEPNTSHQQQDRGDAVNEHQLFGSGQWPQDAFMQSQNRMPDVTPASVLGRSSPATSGVGASGGNMATHSHVNDTNSFHKEDAANGDEEVEDESSYEPVWMGKKKPQPPIPPPKKPSSNDLMNFSPGVEPKSLTFVPGKTTNLVQTFPDESTTDDLIPKLNITDRWGDYVGLDPRASLVYEAPPPLHAPPPLPADAKMVASAPPVPPRPSPNISGLSEKQPIKPSPSEVFADLQTPQAVPFEDDDPFKYSDFAKECKNFNKEGTASNEGWPPATANQFEQRQDDDMFDPFGLGIQSNQSSSSSQWASAATASASASSSSASAISPGTLNRISLSHVPPPPQQLYSRVNKPTQPREDFYSMAQDMEQSLDSSDSSDEPFSTDSMLDGRSRMSDSSSGLSTLSGHSGGASVPIISGQTSQKKTERYGYLYKQGGVKANRGWRRRWVVFSGRDLRYYVNNKSQISKRVIPLACMKKVENDVRDGDTTRFKFRLATTLKDRVFLFASDTLEDCLIWTQTLMAAISVYEMNNNLERPEDSLLESPDKQGYIKFENGGGRKYYVCIRGAILCYYNNMEDFRMCSPVHEISMELASVKDIAKCKLQLSTHYAYFVLSFDSPGEAQQWKMAIEDAIAEGLADDSVLQKVYENDSNRICADCEAPDPHWASINLGIVVCKKCAGIHRMFEAGISKIRSLRMDTRVWTPSLIEIMKAIGNANANIFWEFELMSDQKINPDSTSEIRKNFISNKYKHKRYCQSLPSSTDTRLLNEELLRVAATDDLLELVKIVFSGADIRHHRHGCPDETAYQLAKAAGKRLLMEFLYQNGGDRGSSTDTEDSEGRLREDVRHQGYLFKTGPNYRGFDKRWCVLEHGALSYYLTEKSTTAKDSIERQCIYSLQETSVERQQYAFEISTNKNNRMYLFAAENAGERGLWLRSIGKVVCPVAIMEHVGMMDFSFGGNFYVKDIVTEDWRKTWVMLSWRLLYYMDQNLKLESVDLRVASSIKYQEADRGCKKCAESGQHFVINAPNKALYIQADLVRDTEKAYAACELAMKESGKTLLDQQLTSDNVPVIVDRCINHITLTGLTSQGIYRQSAQQSRVQHLLDDLRKDARAVKLEDYTCDEVANAVKRFFRELDDSVFTKDAYSHWVGTAAVHDTSQKLNWYHYLLEKLPMVNYNTLKKLVNHLHSVSQHTSENRMTRENLATCFAPSLMRTENTEASSTSIGGTLALEMAVLTDIINFHEQLLPVQEHEKKIEDKIAEATAAITRVNNMSQNKRVSNVIDRMITTIYMHSGDGACVTLPIGQRDVTEMVINAIRDKNHLTGPLILTEMLLKGTLERPIHLRDPVLPVTTAWGNHGEDICSDAKLCLKSMDILEKLQNALDPSQILFGEIKFSDKKKFSKYIFQLKQGKLVCFKDSKGRNQLHSWNVEDLIIYLGVDPRRQPGTRTPYGLTFIVRGEKCNKDWFGRSLLFTSENELLKWASALLVAQFPDGIIASFS